MAVVQLTPEDRERYLLRTFQAAFHTLAEFAAKHPARAANVYANIAAHVRSAAPMALLDTGPVARVEVAPDRAPDVRGELADGAFYELTAIGQGVGLYVHGADAHDAHAPMTAAQAGRFRDDFAQLLEKIARAAQELRR